MLRELLFLILAFAASVLSGIFGFGSAIVLIPFSIFIFPIKRGIALITVFFVVSNLSKIIIFRKYINWKLVLLIWAGAVPMVFVGAYLMVIAPTIIIEKILGVIILLYLMNEYLSLKVQRLNNISIIAVSGVYGFFSGIIGTGSVIKAVLLTHLKMSKERFVAVMATSAILLNVIKTVVYTRYELVSYLIYR